MAEQREKRPLLGSIQDTMLLRGDAEAEVATAVSPWRWWALFVFACLSFVQNCAWICFSTVLNDAKVYYAIDDTQVNRLVEVAAVIWLVAVFFVAPFTDRFGLKASIIIGCGCVAAGGVCRWLGETSYTWLMLGQALNALAGPIITNSPPALAAAWFPVHQRATATAIAWNAMSIGVCVGYLVAPRLAPDPSKIPQLNRVIAFVTIGLFALSFTFPAPPRLPPTRSAATEKTGFLAAGPKLLRNPSFLLLTLGWALAGGVFMGWSSMLNIFLDNPNGKFHYSDTELGWLGALGNGMVIIGGIAVPVATDLLGAQRRMKWILVCTSVGCALSVIGFTWLVYFYHGAPPSMWVTGVGFMVGSFFFGANAPIAVELASEIVFPVSEGTSAAYLNLVFMLTNLGGMEIANAVSHRSSNIGVCVVCVIAALALLPMRIPNNRLSIDQGQPHASGLA